LASTTSVVAADAVDEVAPAPMAAPAAMTPVTRTPVTVSRTALLLARLLAVLTAIAQKRGSRSRDLDTSVLL